MKVLITGSHFTPAQAVIEQMLKQPGVEIVYFGRSKTLEGDQTPSVESQVLPALGVKFYPITTGRWQRSFTRYTLPSLAKIPVGIVQSFYLLWKEKPDVVLSFGGYVAIPVIIGAWLLSIPVVVHEQTLVSGLANTLSGLFADKIAVTFEKQAQLADGKRVLTGNPIRSEILNPTNQPSFEIKKICELAKQIKLPLLLITGGNQGSHLINQKVAESVEEITQRCIVVHQTGDSKYRDFDILQKIIPTIKHPERYMSKKWINAADFGYLLNHVDICLSRAGINTLLELSYKGIPTIVVPIPFIFRNEQEVNAAYFSKKGLAIKVSQALFSKELLLEKLDYLIKQYSERKKKALAAKDLIIVDAAKRLALETRLLAAKAQNQSI